MAAKESDIQVARSVDDVERVLRALGISSQARLGGGG